MIRVPIGDTLLAQLAGSAHEHAIDLIAWKLGLLEVLTVPGEGFHGVEGAIRSVHGDPLLIAGLAPDWHGYFPVPYTDGYEEGLSLGPTRCSRSSPRTDDAGREAHGFLCSEQAGRHARAQAHRSPAVHARQRLGGSAAQRRRAELIPR